MNRAIWGCLVIACPLFAQDARQIVEELRHQYVIAFEASNRTSGWRALEVRARDRGLTVRARAGYSSGGNGVVSEAQKLR